MESQITKLELHDIRFPTYLQQVSDAIHVNPAYSAAYVIIHTSNPNYKGYGFTFTIGRGNEIVLACIKALEFMVVGKKLNEITNDFGKYWKEITNESQLRWLGPHKGVIHLAVAAIVNGLWDLWARIEKKPVWKLIVDMSPEEIIKLMDFTYVEEFLNKEEAFSILKRGQTGKSERINDLVKEGYPGYVTSAGWLNYSSDQIRKNIAEATSQGFSRFKMKVGQDIKADKKRMEFIRSIIGQDKPLMVDANQVWSVNQSIENMRILAEHNPYWIEEPTSCDDVLGHKAISWALKSHDSTRAIRVATGEHCQNSIVFKQFLQSGAMDVCQIDSCRLAGPNEILLVILMAHKAGVPVCPHAGGIGLCELVQHYSYIDYILVSCTKENRMLEYVDHLHEYFENPVVVKNGCYQLPMAAGFSSKFIDNSYEDFEYPNGKEWKKLENN